MESDVGEVYNHETNEHPARWSGMEIMFGKHVSQLSEIFGGGLKQFLSTGQELLTGLMTGSLMQRNACKFAAVIHGKREAFLQLHQFNGKYF